MIILILMSKFILLILFRGYNESESYREIEKVIQD